MDELRHAETAAPEDENEHDIHGDKGQEDRQADGQQEEKCTDNQGEPHPPFHPYSSPLAGRFLYSLAPRLLIWPENCLTNSINMRK